jgi:hypothetical protein
MPAPIAVDASNGGAADHEADAASQDSASPGHTRAIREHVDVAAAVAAHHDGPDNVEIASFGSLEVVEVPLRGIGVAVGRDVENEVALVRHEYSLDSRGDCVVVGSGLVWFDGLGEQGALSGA